MNRSPFLPVFVLLYALTISATPNALAQSQPVPTSVNLVGTWDFVFDEIEWYSGLRGEDINLDVTMTITEQNGSIVRGQINYTLDAEIAHDGEKIVTERDLGIMGVISWSGDEVTLISHGESDAWVLSGLIVNPSVIEMIAYESGEHAWISKKLAFRR